MDGILVLIIVIVALVGLDLAAARWGTDSRPGMADDHRR
jgi:hypothetical protein